MKITVLIENKTKNKQLCAEHGLSIAIESDNKKILMDTGASPSFIHNASKLNFDLKDINKLIISHAHYDHVGGLEAFLDVNKIAQVYLKKEVEGAYLAKHGVQIEYIGLNNNLIKHPRFVYTSDKMEIDSNVFLFSVGKIKYDLPVANRNLYKMVDGQLKPDDFLHEQNLVVLENKKYYLFCGCAHNGLQNIIEEFKRLFSTYPYYVVGGFHLASRSGGFTEDKENIIALSSYLDGLGAKFLTGHCTGEYPHEILKEKLKDKISLLHTGLEMII